jgi:hypothetical protein
LIYCKNFYKCHNVPLPTTTIKKNSMWAGFGKDTLKFIIQISQDSLWCYGIEPLSLESSTHMGSSYKAFKFSGAGWNLEFMDSSGLWPLVWKKSSTCL